MTRYIALTGGIGSGKSVVSRIFSCMGVPVYDSDNNAKLLMESNQVIINGLRNLIGEDLYENGRLQKDVMAKAIFSDKQLCDQVNAIVHPRVWLDYKRWSDGKNVPFTIMETALLYETDLYRNFDVKIAVTASEEVCIQRVMQRNACDANAVKERVEKQTSVQRAVREADFVIENNDTFVLSQVIEIMNAIKKNYGVC